MRNIAVSVIAAGALTSAALGLAGVATAAPSGPSTISQTVNALQANGYRVLLNKVGGAPLDQCSITGVRPGQTFSRTDSGAPGAGSDVITTVTDKTVYIDLAC